MRDLELSHYLCIPIRTKKQKVAMVIFLNSEILLFILCQILRLPVVCFLMNIIQENIIIIIIIEELLKVNFSNLEKAIAYDLKCFIKL